METVKIEIYLDAEGQLLVDMQNALEGGIAEDLAQRTAQTFRNDLADYLSVPVTLIRYEWHVIKDRRLDHEN